MTYVTLYKYCEPKFPDCTRPLLRILSLIYWPILPLLSKNPPLVSHTYYTVYIRDEKKRRRTRGARSLIYKNPLCKHMCTTAHFLAGNSNFTYIRAITSPISLYIRIIKRFSSIKRTQCTYTHDEKNSLCRSRLAGLSALFSLVRASLAYISVSNTPSERELHSRVRMFAIRVLQERLRMHYFGLFGGWTREEWPCVYIHATHDEKSGSGDVFCGRVYV